MTWHDRSRSFYLEHLKRLQANSIQPHFMLAHIAQLETVERLIRRGIYKGPLILNYVGIGGGAAGTHPADLLEFARRTPDGAVLTIEAESALVIPMSMIAIAHRTARARRDRGQYLAAQGRAHDLGAADRADGASRPRGRSRRRERHRRRATSTRSACSTTRPRKRSPSSAWCRTESLASAASRSGPRRNQTMNRSSALFGGGPTLATRPRRSLPRWARHQPKRWNVLIDNRGS